MNVRIRSYCAEDANAINRIALAAWDQYRTVFSDWPLTASVLASTASMAKELELLIAEDETAILGFVGYVAPGRPREKIFRREWATIRMLSVDPSARGRGIGRQLTEECIRRACRDGAPFIALHTSPIMEVALAMYIRIGFIHERDIVDRHGVHYAMYSLRLPD
jgi:ribosomal protein S18 acetylase RimI-like enzyme